MTTVLLTAATALGAASTASTAAAVPTATPAAAATQDRPLPSVAEREALVRPATDRLVAQLRQSLTRADEGRRVSARHRPAVDRIRRNLWDGPGICASSGTTSRHGICTFGDVAGDRTVVALGSSHMTMWMAGLTAAAERRGTRVVGLFKYGCTPYDLRSTRDGTEWQACSDFREWAVDTIARIAPDTVIVGSHSAFDVLGDDGSLLEGRAWTQEVTAGAARLVSRVLPHTDDVVVLGDVTPRTRDPQRCLQRTKRSYRRCESPEDPAHRALVRATGDAVRAEGADFFDTNHLICVQGRCPVAAAGRYVYRDASHVSRVWSQRVGSLMATRVGVR
ncbi:hypothetical protein KLP28_16275 [Nocardioidaceae bacterium]|nr:hypothetical protein KLP28_16275 [Nocardioidaceae bacterium]